MDAPTIITTVTSFTVHFRSNRPSSPLLLCPNDAFSLLSFLFDGSSNSTTMGFEVYEDPTPQPATNAMLAGSSRKPFPSGRTPLGKRTNQGSAVDNNGSEKGVEKKNTINQTQTQEPLEKKGAKTQRHVHFSDREAPENKSRASQFSSPLNDLRQKLRAPTPEQGALYPATPALGQRRTSTMSPSTLLRTEMDSTPDDSLMLVSPGGHHESASTRY